MKVLKITEVRPLVLDGVVAFFDIMGFREMLGSNEPEEINTLVREVFHQIPGNINHKHMEMSTYGFGSYFESFIVTLEIKSYAAQTSLPATSVVIPSDATGPVNIIWNLGRVNTKA